MNDEIKEPILKARGIHRSFNLGSESLKVLRGIDFEIYEGEDACIVGSSGAGKSTLLQILGTLDRPTLGRVYYRGQDLIKKSDDDLAQFRNLKLGFVFQFHHLLTEFTALENVALPVRIGGGGAKDAVRRAEELLAHVGLKDRLKHYPAELSGGEKQRVAIARALVREPEILMADEPTGNLDTENSRIIQELFFQLKSQMGLTLIVVTHDRNFSQHFSRIQNLKDGLWDEDYRPVTSPPIV